jgi:glyoxylase-like metal-dependent hydrolase (beta-lactamase superfamily II)
VHRIAIPTPFTEAEVNAYLLVGEPLTLVDCGPLTPEGYAALTAGVRQAGFALTDVAQLVLTHLHADHDGNLRRLMADVPSIRVFAHRAGCAALCGGAQERERQAAFLLTFLREAGLREAELEAWTGQRRPEPEALPSSRVTWLDDGDTLRAGGTVWRVLFTPGHSQTQICLFDASSGALLASDHLLPHISPNALAEAPPPGTPERPRPLLQYRRELQRLRDLPVSVIYPGHGGPFDDLVGHIDRRLREHEQRCDRIAEVLATGPRTAVQVSAALFPRLRGRGVFLGISEVVGHLDLLVERGRVAAERRDGALWYRLVAGAPG